MTCQLPVRFGVSVRNAGRTLTRFPKIETAHLAWLWGQVCIEENHETGDLWKSQKDFFDRQGLLSKLIVFKEERER